VADRSVSFPVTLSDLEWQGVKGHSSTGVTQNDRIWNGNTDDWAYFLGSATSTSQRDKTPSSPQFLGSSTFKRIDLQRNLLW